jgi:hypothetical protein
MVKMLKGKTDEELEIPAYARYRRPLSSNRPRPMSGPNTRY